MDGQYNLRSPAVKRLMREAQELAEPTEEYFAQPLDSNLFEWHFTIRGPSETDFEGGVYHGRIILPPDYPMKPPSIMFLTPNGRFECSMKICLSISKHHPETWQPSWSIRTALLAMIGFMPSPGHGAIGSLDYTPHERKNLARRSVKFNCPQCGQVADKLLPITHALSEDTRKQIQDLASQLSMQAEKKKPNDEPTSDTSSVSADSPETGGGSNKGEVPNAHQPQTSVMSDCAANTTSSSSTAGDSTTNDAIFVPEGVRQRVVGSSVSPQSNPSSSTTNANTAANSNPSTADKVSKYAMICIIAIIIYLIFRRFTLSQFYRQLVAGSE